MGSGQKFRKLLQDRLRWFLVLAAVLVLGALWIWLSTVPAAATTDGQIPSPRQGFAAPTFRLESLSGAEIDLADLKGKVVVVNLWASWCPPCRAEMPAMERVYQAHMEDGLEILAINTTFQDSQEAAQAFVQELELSFPILLDRSGETSRQYLLRAMPSTFFVDRQGIIQRVIIGGPMSEATLETTIQDLLREVP